MRCHHALRRARAGSENAAADENPKSRLPRNFLRGEEVMFLAHSGIGKRQNNRGAARLTAQFGQFEAISAR